MGVFLYPSKMLPLVFNFKAIIFCFLPCQKRFPYYFVFPEVFLTHQNFFLWLFFPLYFLFAGVKSPKSARYLNTC